MFNTHQSAQPGRRQKAQLALTAEDRRRARITATREIYAKCDTCSITRTSSSMRTATARSSLILNMNGEAYEQADNARKYFTACLLAYYQQLWLWSTDRREAGRLQHRKAAVGVRRQHCVWRGIGHSGSSELLFADS
jgi:predicted ATP-binding protein involved in virulence